MKICLDDENVSLFENRLFDLTNEIQKAEEQKQHGMIELDQINASITIAKQELNSYNVALDSKIRKAASNEERKQFKKRLRK
jgi:hypothetical protein